MNGKTSTMLKHLKASTPEKRAYKKLNWLQKTKVRAEYLLHKGLPNRTLPSVAADAGIDLV